MLRVLDRLGPRFAWRASGGASDFAHCSESRQSHKAVSSSCRGRFHARSSTDYPFTSSCSPRPDRQDAVSFRCLAGSTARKGLAPFGVCAFPSARARVSSPAACKTTPGGPALRPSAVAPSRLREPAIARVACPSSAARATPSIAVRTDGPAGLSWPCCHTSFSCGCWPKRGAPSRIHAGGKHQHAPQGPEHRTEGQRPGNGPTNPRTSPERRNTSTAPDYANGSRRRPSTPMVAATSMFRACTPERPLAFPRPPSAQPTRPPLRRIGRGCVKVRPRQCRRNPHPERISSGSPGSDRRRASGAAVLPWVTSPRVPPTLKELDRPLIRQAKKPRNRPGQAPSSPTTRPALHSLPPSLASPAPVRGDPPVSLQRAQKRLTLSFRLHAGTAITLRKLSTPLHLRRWNHRKASRKKAQKTQKNHRGGARSATGLPRTILTRLTGLFCAFRAFSWPFAGSLPATAPWPPRQRQRRCVLQPRVARHKPPWVAMPPPPPLPQRGCVQPAQSSADTRNPPATRERFRHASTSPDRSTLNAQRSPCCFDQIAIAPRRQRHLRPPRPLPLLPDDPLRRPRFTRRPRRILPALQLCKD